MKPSLRKAASGALAALCLFLCKGHTAETVVPYPAGSHLQRVRKFYASADGLPADHIQALAVTPGGSVIAAASNSVAQLDADGTRWRVAAHPSGVAALFAPREGPIALAGAANGVWALSGGAWALEENSPEQAMCFAAEPGGIVWAMAPSGVWRRENGWKLVNGIADDEMAQPHAFLPRGSNDVLIAAETGLFALVGKRPYWLGMEVRAGGLLSSKVRSIAALDASHFLVATDKGLNLTDGFRGWQSFTGAEGLPILDNHHLAVAPDGTIWLGSDDGLIEWKQGAWAFLESKRWLPDNHVTAIAPAPDGSVWVGTPKGISHLYQRKLTFGEKADILQHDLENRNRRYGFVTQMELRAPGVLDGAVQEISDNDGLWTSLYVASQSFRFASTKSPEAKAQAWRSMQALLRLESITGISGFPARAICPTNEAQFAQRRLGSDSEWHASPVEPGWYWKGETSSDEIDGHYFGWYVFAALAANDAEREQVRATCKRVTDHIIDHGYYLFDKDGRPTTWGFWNPERLNDDPRYWEERGLNSLEMLSHLKVASYIVKDPRYDRAYQNLIRKHHYALNTIPAKLPHGVVFDNELLFLAYYPLLQLERDPALRAIYLTSMKRTWDAIRIEANPVWNFMYGACSGNPCDLEAAIQTLREIPLDFIHWRMRNSQRADLDSAHRKPLPWTNRVLHNWDSNPYDLDGGSDQSEGDQTVWLLPYWLGRHHQLVD
jgi:Two component regulator propeller